MAATTTVNTNSQHSCWAIAASTCGVSVWEKQITGEITEADVFLFRRPELHLSRSSGDRRAAETHGAPPLLLLTTHCWRGPAEPPARRPAGPARGTGVSSAPGGGDAPTAACRLCVAASLRPVCSSPRGRTRPAATHCSDTALCGRCATAFIRRISLLAAFAC